ncbi:hypothetical protein PsYK624_025990 [Phanerochaete sordida]|uniref:F-box domain-containing protein n=1 Tax=Phanerochaete sordida TaxID=48140 RepID=A0A9P3G266_9APHY|nr:hypothetical protein PsYK624_025990 [Phanerochaete sordida]
MDFKTKRLRVEELDAEVEQLQRKAEDLLKQVETVRHAIRENRRERVTCTPLHSLPDDVLKLILEAAYEHDLGAPCPETRALEITHVSRRLRQFSLSLPRLWRCIHVEQSKPLLEQALLRSATLPLYVSCIGKDLSETANQSDKDVPLQHAPWAPRYLRQLEYALQQAPRIEYLMLDTTIVAFFEGALNCIRRRTFPLLKTLEVHFVPTTLALNPTAVFHLPSCPALGTLCVSAVPIVFKNPSFARLEKVDINCLDVYASELHDLAAAAPTLDSLYLDEVHIIADTDHTIRFPTLNYLAVGNIHNIPSVQLDRFDIPALESLYVFSSTEPERPGALDSGGPRPFTAVHTLSFRDVETPAATPHASDLLRYAPNATVLELLQTSKATSLLDQLAAADPPPLPALEMLVVTGLEKEKHEILLRVVQHRIKHEIPLKEMQLGADILHCVDGELQKALEEHVTITTASDDDE